MFLTFENTKTDGEIAVCVDGLRVGYLTKDQELVISPNTLIKPVSLGGDKLRQIADRLDGMVLYKLILDEMREEGFEELRKIFGCQSKQEVVDIAMDVFARMAKGTIDAEASRHIVNWLTGVLRVLSLRASGSLG